LKRGRPKKKGDLRKTHFASDLSGYEFVKKIGKGAHGVVYLARNKEGKIKAIKTYSKDHEAEFINEVCIWATLKSNGLGNEVGIEGMFETEDFYGMIITAGIGTVFDYKEFILANDIKLSEDQLINIFLQLFQNFKAYSGLGFAHRDIKPANIIIYISSKKLKFQIIDFSLALCLESEKFCRAGTLNYLDPYLLDPQNKLITLDFLRGDLFSIGIILLELAVYTFTPQQNDWISIENALSILADKPKIHRLLSFLLDKNENRNQRGKEGFDKYFAELEQLVNDHLKEGNKNIPDEDKESEKFQSYLFERFQTLKIHKEELSKNNDGQNHLKSIQFTRKDNDSGSLVVLDWPVISQSLAYFHEKNDNLNQILCYKSLLKHSIQINDQNQINLFSNIVRKLVEKLDKFSISSFVFSTLGVACYKLFDLERASQLFLKGLEITKDEVEKILLLNNLGCIFSLTEATQQEAKEKFEEAYILIRNQIKSFTYQALNIWSTLKASNVKSPDLISIQSFELKRSFEYVLLAEKSLPKDWKEPIDDRMNLFFVIFQNYCFCQAQNMLNFLDHEQDENLLEKLIYNSYSLSLQNSAFIRLDFELEILVNLLKFAAMFTDAKEDFQQEKSFIKINQESSKLLEEKKYLIEKIDQRNLFTKEFEEKSELLSLMIGLSNIFRGNEQQSVEGAFKQILKDVEKYLDKHEVNIRAVSGGIKYGGGFSQSLKRDLEVPFEEINNFARDFSIKEKIIMPLIPEQCSHCLRSCGYKMTFSEDQTCPKLIFNSLDLYCNPNFLSGFEKDHIESLTLELSNELFTSDEEASKMSKNFIGLKNLKRLELSVTSFAQFKGQNFKPLTDALGSLHELQELKVVFGWALECELTIQYIEEAITKLQRLKNLEIIFGYHPNLTDDRIFSLAKNLCKVENLKDITLEFSACASISRAATQKIQDILLASQKNPLVLVYPMRLYSVSFS